MLDRITLERRAGVGLLRSLVTYTAALTVAIALSLGVMVWAGVPTGALFEELIVQVFLSEAGLARTLTAATPMVLAALAAALCLRLKFWNIGIEGQLLMGAVLATTVALSDIGGPLRLRIMLIASALGGALWIALPAQLKIRFGISEVIVTLLSSNIAFLFLQHLLFGPFGDTSHNFPTSPVFDETEKLPRFGFGDVHLGLVIALVAVLVMALVTHRMRFGFAARIAGDNARAAQAMGFDMARIMLISILVGGAMAGLAGGVIVAGTEHRLTQAVGLHMTFNGIIIAALARILPLLIPVVSFFIAGLAVASQSLKVFYGVLEGIVLIIQGIILLTLVTFQFATTYRVTMPLRGRHDRVHHGMDGQPAGVHDAASDGLAGAPFLRTRRCSEPGRRRRDGAERHDRCHGRAGWLRGVACDGADAIAGALISVPFMIAVVVFRAPQIPAGLALVAIGLGASQAIGRDAAHKPFAGLQPLPWPDALVDLPIIGRLLFEQDGVVVLALVIAGVAAWSLFRTSKGLRLRAVGEDPATADAAGVDVQSYQIAAMVIGSLLIGLAGAYLSVGGSQIWTEGTVAGRGWIALALVVFAQWSLVRAIFGAALFGGAEALIPRLRAMGLELPVYLLSMKPYVLTIAVLLIVSFGTRTRQSEPGFLGRAYIRQDR